MKIGFIKENSKHETRIPIIPKLCKKLTDLGAEVLIEQGIGKSVNIEDEIFSFSGGTIRSRQEIFQSADILVRINLPEIDEIAPSRQEYRGKSRDF